MRQYPRLVSAPALFLRRFKQRHWIAVRHIPMKLATLVVFIWIVTAAAAAGINSDSIWVDEYLSLRYAGWGQEDFQVSTILSRILSQDDHRVITYDLLLAGWAKLVGWSVFGARLLTLLLGLLAIAWAYRCGADLHSPAAGVYSAILLGASALMIVYMHEIRAYAFWALLTLIMLWLYWRIVQGGAKIRTQLAFTLAIIATLYTHPFAVALVGALGLYHLLLARGARAYRRLLLLFAVAGILYLPLAIGTLEVIFLFSGDSRPPRTLRGNTELLSQLAYALSNGTWLLLLLPACALPRLRRDQSVQMLCFVGIVFLGVMLAANSRSGIIQHVRYLIPLAPITALLGGTGCASLIRRQRFAALILLAWLLFGLHAARDFRYAFYHVVERDIFHLTFPFKELAAEIRRDSREGDAAVFEFPHHSFALQGVFDYYMSGLGMRYVLADALRSAGSWEGTLASFERFIADAERMYFVLDRTIEATDFVPEYERILTARFVRCERLWDTDQASVDKYALDQSQC